MVKDRRDEAQLTARLSLVQTYMPKTPVDFAGPSYFGGTDDGLVLCAGKGMFFDAPLMPFLTNLSVRVQAGDIHIWDRETSVLLHHFRTQDLDGDLTCIAWNQAAVPFMFVTGSHDGAVRIWTSPSAAMSPTAYPGLQIPPILPSVSSGGSVNGDAVSVTVVPNTPTGERSGGGFPRRDSYSYYRDGHTPQPTPTHARRASLLADVYPGQSQQHTRGRPASATPPAGLFPTEIRLERTESPAAEHEECECERERRSTSRSREKRAVLFTNEMMRLDSE